MIINRDRKLRRKRRVSCNIVGTTERPRVSIHRTNKYIYAQVINDETATVITSYSSLQLINAKKDTKGTKCAISKLIGQELAKLLHEKSVDKVVFDRGVYTYNGRVKFLAEGLREGNINV